MSLVERCFICQEPTGKAGASEDSIYSDSGDLGPFCEKCWDSEMAPKIPESVADVHCPQCKKPFALRWDEDGHTTLCIRACESGGIYGVRIQCPHCDFEEEI